MIIHLNNEIFVFYLADCTCTDIVQRTHSTNAICKIHIMLNLLMYGLYNPISIPCFLILSSPLGGRFLLVLEFFNKILSASLFSPMLSTCPMQPILFDYTTRKYLARCKNHETLNLWAPCVLYIGQEFRYFPENAFYIFNQQIYLIIWYLLDRASLI